MSGRAVIADTNVVVAGLLTGNEASPVARILDGMLSATFPFVVSEALLAEYRVDPSQLQLELTSCANRLRTIQLKMDFFRNDKRKQRISY